MPAIINILLEQYVEEIRKIYGDRLRLDRAIRNVLYKSAEGVGSAIAFLF